MLRHHYTTEATNGKKASSGGLAAKVSSAGRVGRGPGLCYNRVVAARDSVPHARRLTRLKWLVIFAANLLVAIITAGYYVTGVSLAQCLLGMTVGIVGATILAEGTFRVVTRLEGRLRQEILGRQQVEDTLQQRNQALALLDQANQAFNSSLDVDQVIVNVLEEARGLFDIAACSVWLVDQETSELVCWHTSGPSGEVVRGWRLPPGHGIVGWIAERGESVIVPDVQSDERYFGGVAEQVGLDLRSILGVPLRIKEDVIGVLEVVDTQVARFSERDAALMEALAASAAIAIGNARLFEAVTEQREQLRALAARLSAAEEAERQRLSRELHDQVGQNLTALGINMNLLQSQMGTQTEGTSARLEECLVLVEETAEVIRNLTSDLRPPVLDDYGLVAALRWYGNRFASRMGITVRVEDGGGPVTRLAAPVEIALFRIAQEALNNVSKHAQATEVTISVEMAPDRLRMTIADNGVGFSPARRRTAGERRGWGLITMAERAEGVGGHCHIDSAPGEGTRVVVEVAR